MNGKKIDLHNSAKEKLKKSNEVHNIDWLFQEGEGLKKMPLKVTAVYAAIGGCWILFSDRILDILIESKSIMVKAQTIKGWVYVLLTSFIIYILTQLSHDKNTSFSFRQPGNVDIK